MTFRPKIIREAIFIPGSSPSCHIGALVVQADVDFRKADWDNRAHAFLKKLDRLGQLKSENTKVSECEKLITKIRFSVTK